MNVLDVMRLYRIHTGAATAAIPALGFLAAGGSYPGSILIALAALSHHAWGFSLNEVMDLNVDRMSKDLGHKPLVSGRMSQRTGFLFSIIALLISFCFLAAAAFLERGDIGGAVFLLILSTISGALYDIVGKKFPLADIFVGGWMFFLVLAAASASGGLVGIGVWAVACLSGLHLLFNNSVEGGIKDVENDREAGVKTFAVVTGSRFPKGRLQLTPVFWLWGAFLRGLFVIGAAVFSYLIVVEEGFHIRMVLLVSFLGILLFNHFLSFIRNGVNVKRKKLLGRFSLHEIASFFLSILVVLPAVGLIPSLIVFIVPALWFFLFNKAMYGSKMAPGV